MTDIISIDSKRRDIPIRPARARSPALEPVKREEPTAKPNPALSLKVKDEDQKSSLSAIERPLEAAAALLEEIVPEVSQVSNTRLRIDQDQETGKFIYYNIDNESGEVVRQFPPESILKYLKQVQSVEGLVLDDKV